MVSKDAVETHRENCHFTGVRDVSELEEQLVGIRYDPEAIASALGNIDIRPYFGDLERTAIINLLY